MEPDKILYLTRTEVAACNISLARSLEISENTYSEHAKGHYEMPPKPGVHPDSCPGAFYWLGCQKADTPFYPLHSDHFSPDEAAIKIGREVMLSSVFTYLNE